MPITSQGKILHANGCADRIFVLAIEIVGRGFAEQTHGRGAALLLVGENAPFGGWPVTNHEVGRGGDVAGW